MSEGLNFRVSGRLLDEAVNTAHLAKVERAAIVVAANTLVHGIKESLTNKYKRVNEQNPKYKDRMIDAVRFGRIFGSMTVVHAYGTSETGSGTYRTRFLAGTKPRKHKKTGRYLGRIPTDNWFGRGVDHSEDKAAASMEDIFSRYIENYQ